MAKTDVQHDVIVIGAGIAGLVAANRAAQLGKRVIVLEKSKEEVEEIKLQSAEIGKWPFKKLQQSTSIGK